jgi:uncharacterized membrane protein YczE
LAVVRSADRSANRWARLPQLVISRVVLGVGVALLLLAALGSDGYSTFVNGLSLALDVPFVAVNCALGIVLVALAWWRGLVPGLGTIIQPLVVGATVSAVLSMVSAPQAVVSRVVVLAAAFVILSAGVAGYLGSGTGAGPTEAAALAFDPPIPFRWSYTIVQGSGALSGWLLGAAIGPGTLLVIAILGPAVDLMTRRMPALGALPVRRAEAQEC